MCASLKLTLGFINCFEVGYMARTPVKPGNWGTWATIHGEGIYEPEFDSQSVSKTSKGENSVQIVPCLFAKVSGHAWRLCTNRKSSFYKSKCLGECKWFKEDKTEAILFAPLKTKYGGEEWKGIEVKGKKRKKNRKRISK